MTMTSQPVTDEVRLIEAQAAPTRFARGWHCLGLIRDFADGKPHAINAFGHKLVVFSSGPLGEGNINVLDAYLPPTWVATSPKVRSKATRSRVPFHDWRWGGDGRCKKVPYSRRTPKLARTQAWITLQQDGMLFVWNDPERKPPPPEVTIPRIEGATSDEWTDWHWYTTVVTINCREIIDNVVDMAHFYYIHGALPTYFKNVFEGQTSQRST